MIISGKNVQIEKGAIVGYSNIQKPREEYTNDIKIGDNTIIRCGAIIYEGVQIGKNCMINHYAVIRENTEIGDNTTIGGFTQIEGNSKIGNGCSICPQCHITAYTTIGNNVFMAPFCCLTNDPVMGYKRPQLHKNRIIKGPTIEDNVRISVGVLIQPGLTIGRESVLGTGSIVTKNIPPNSIAFGIPAKVVKEVSKEHFIRD